MARCTKCQTEWTFKDKAKMYKSLSGAKECPYCGAEQYVSLKSKQQGTMLNFVTILAIIVPILFNISLWLHIILAIVVIAAVVSVQISLVKLSSTEEFPA